MAVSLRVLLPRGATTDVLSLAKLKPDTLVSEVTDKAVAEAKLIPHEQYALVVPGPRTRWLEPDKSIAALGLTAKGTTVALTRNHLLACVTCFDGNFTFRRLALPVTVPLHELLPYVARKLHVQELEDFEFLVEGSSAELALDQPLCAQKVDFTDSFLLKNKMLQIDETSLRIFRDIRNGVTVSAEDRRALGFQGSVLESPAKTLLLDNPKLNGFLGRLNKKKKWDRLFGIVHKENVFLYKTQNDPKPLFVLPLLAYDLIETVEEDDKKKKGQAVKCAFEMRLNDERKKQDEPHILKADTEQWYSQWIEAIRNAKDEAVAIAESKRRRTDDGSTPLVFGRPLADAVSKADGSELPAIVTQTISYLEAHVKAEGIFRLSGSATEIAEYKRKYDAGEEVSFDTEQDCHNVSGLLKLYFRQMPEPVLTHAMFFNFVMSEYIENVFVRLRYLKHLLGRLPPLNYALLKYLIAFLIRVSAHSDVNKMAMHNLATVFAPNLLQQKDATMMQIVEHTPQVNSIVCTFIKHFGVLFGDEPIPDDVGDRFAGSAAKALYDYAGESEENLSFKVGDLINIIVQGQDGWWEGECDNRFGKFPASYVRVLDKEEWKKAARKTNYHAEVAGLRARITQEERTIEQLQERKAALAAEVNELQGRKGEIEVDLSSVAAKLNGKFGAANVKELNARLTGVCKKLEESRATRFAIEEKKQAFGEATSTMTKEVAAFASDNKKKKEKKYDKLVEKLEATLVACTKSVQATEAARKHSTILEDDVRHEVDCLRLLVEFTLKST